MNGARDIAAEEAAELRHAYDAARARLLMGVRKGRKPATWDADMATVAAYARTHPAPVEQALPTCRTCGCNVHPPAHAANGGYCRRCARRGAK